jgi:uncharacterized membrane protein YdjX (TVP38/TMEM64 family)
MEWLLKWMDDLDDLLAVVHVHTRSVVVTLLLLAAFLTVLGGVLVFGPPDLLAAP